jgi:hypothetical protein
MGSVFRSNDVRYFDRVPALSYQERKRCTVFPRSSRLRSAVLAVLSVLAAVVALAVGAPAATAAGSLPCDVYAAAGTPCVAAHSLVRALYSSYNGSLYQVQRASDSATANIGLLAAGGYANAAA